MVQIDMEMPKDCQICRFCFFDEVKSKLKCFAAEPPMEIGDEDLRRVFCPLKEVKDDN